MTRIRTTLLLLLMLFWALSLDHLTVLPAIYEDESWLASVGWQWATEGRFASDLFAGRFGMEQRTYTFTPPHAFLSSLLFRGAGVGLFQARFVNVALGLLALALLFTLGKRLWSGEHGALAVALLMLTVGTTQTPSQLSGILWIDVSRIHRYDMVVPPLALAALLAAHRAQTGGGDRWWLVAALLAGLSSFAHPVGGAMVAVVLLLALWAGASRRTLALMIGAALLPWLPYLFYVMADLTAFQGQTRLYGDRFDLLNPAWYVANLRAEPLRYAVGAARSPWVAWPGLVLAWLALRRRAACGDVSARLVVVAALLMPLCFALFLSSKFINYRVLIEPIWALLGAWAILALWRWQGHGGWARLGRVLLVAGLLLMALEGMGRLAAMAAQAAESTPYPTLIAQIRRHVPDGTRLLGMHNYWLGMESTDYRAWVVPLSQADGDPQRLAQALDTLDPEVVLIDRNIREYLDHPPPADPLPAAVWRWLDARGYRPTIIIDDPTYGRIELWKRSSEM